MNISPDSPPPLAIPRIRSSLRSRSLSCEIEICAESSRAVDSSTDFEAYGHRIYEDLSTRIASRSSGYGDGKGFNAAKTQFCSRHRLEAWHANQDDDYDDMQWANSKEHLQITLQSSGYSDGKGSYAEQLESYRPHQIKAGKHEKKDDADDYMQRVNTTKPLQTVIRTSGCGDGKSFSAANVSSGKENTVRYLCKPVSYPISIAMQQHSGFIKPNSGPFSGPLKPVVKPNSVPKPNQIIPINLLRKKLLGFNICEPMSPKVTCLGRVKITEVHGKEVHMTTDDNLVSTVEQKAEKGRCFDAKNQLCGRKGKGRKKKKVADKTRCPSRKRRFALKEVTESKSFSSTSETVQTRREKAASLASSLSGLLEDMRRLEKGATHYVPSVPPQNSLLLMRGNRRMTFSPRGQNAGEATINDECVRECVESSTLVEDVPSAVNVMKVRKSPAPHFSLLDLIDMEENIIQEDSAPSEKEDTMTTQGIPAIVHSSSFFVEKESCATAGDNEMMNNKGSFSPPPPPAAMLWQRRSFAELCDIEVRQRAKLNSQLRVMR